MFAALEQMLFILVTTLPYRLLSYYPFMDRLRFPRKTIFFLIGATEVAMLFGVLLFNQYALPLRYLEYLFTPLSTVIYFACIRVHWCKLAFFYCFIVDYLMIVRGLSIFVIAGILMDANFMSWRLSAANLIIFGLTLPFMITFLQRTVDRIFTTEAPHLWRTIWSIPFLTTAVVLIFTGNLTYESVTSWTFLFTRIALLICIFLVYYFLLQSLDTIRKEAALEEKNRVNAQLIALHASQYSNLQKHIEDTRRARHDLRQHLSLIQSYLDNDDKAALMEYIRAYGKSLPPNLGKCYCQNYAINTIVGYYADLAETDGIPVEIQLSFSPTLPVSAPDICVLLGNLFENALDACKKSRPEEAFIRLRGRMLGARGISITLDNHCAHPPELLEGRFLSSKHPGFGIGTVSIANITEQYNGIADFKYDAHVFYASILLKPTEKLEGGDD